MQQISRKAIIPRDRIAPVYAATWTRDEGNIDIAVLKFQELTEEHQKLATIKHPNIISIIGYSINGLDEYCLITPRLTARHLTKVLYSETPDLDTRLNWAYEISLGLMTLHANKLVHLNLSTHTVIFNNENKPVLVDLQCMLPSGNLSETTDTLPFMAPEQLLTTNAPTAACDAYSFGMVLWCCLTQRKPMANKDLSEIRFAIAKQDQREIIPEETPRSLASLIKFCWEKNPTDRKTTKKIGDELLTHLSMKR